MNYLSSRQALEDAATFIRNMTRQHDLTPGKWIVFGGSYAGNLAAWMREKYPELVLGAISSSAPLLAKVDFSGESKRCVLCISRIPRRRRR